MTGPQALNALIEGQAVRIKYWTAGNRLWREWDEDLNTHVIKFDGTELFNYDVRYGNGVWLVEHFADKDDIWEVYE